MTVPAHASPVIILVLAHDAGIGGAQISLLEILERLDRRRFEPVVIVPTPGPFLAELRARRIRHHVGLAQRWVFFSKPTSCATILRHPWMLLRHPYLWAVVSCITLPLRVVLLAAIARYWKAGLIYTNTATVLDGALAARLAGIPHIWHLREAVAGNPDLDFPLPVSWLPRFVLAHADRVIVNSESLRRKLFGANYPAHTRVIWNGVDLEVQDNDAVAPLPAAIPAGAHLAGICGRVTERKAIPVYLRAAARLMQDFPELHHLIIGEGAGERVRALQAMAAELGLTGRVHFLGFRNDVPALMRRLNILVSSAVAEPFGRTLIEAMALGIPVVATRSGGPEEIVADGKTGFLVNVGDAEALADRMARLLSDTDLVRAFGEAARLRAHRHFNLRQTVASVQQIFEEVIAAGR